MLKAQHGEYKFQNAGGPIPIQKRSTILAYSASQ